MHYYKQRVFLFRYIVLLLTYMAGWDIGPPIASSLGVAPELRHLRIRLTPERLLSTQILLSIGQYLHSSICTIFTLTDLNLLTFSVLNHKSLQYIQLNRERIICQDYVMMHRLRRTSVFWAHFCSRLIQNFQILNTLTNGYMQDGAI